MAIPAPHALAAEASDWAWRDAKGEEHGVAALEQVEHLAGKLVAVNKPMPTRSSRRLILTWQIRPMSKGIAPTLRMRNHSQCGHCWISLPKRRGLRAPPPAHAGHCRSP